MKCITHNDVYDQVLVIRNSESKTWSPQYSSILPVLLFDSLSLFNFRQRLTRVYNTETRTNRLNQQCVTKMLKRKCYCEEQQNSATPKY